MSRGLGATNYGSMSRDKLIKEIKFRDERILYLLAITNSFREEKHRKIVADGLGVNPEDVAYVEIKKQ